MTPEEAIELCNKIDDDCVGLSSWEVQFINDVRDQMYKSMDRFGDRAMGPTQRQINKLNIVYEERRP